jgi:tetratricopeptide (TPR) repeat protein
MGLRFWLAPLALTVSLFGNVTARAADADALFAQGKFAEALAAYQAVPKSDAAYAAALRRQGTIHLMANRWPEAEHALKAALTIDAADKKAAAAMAELESRRGNFAEAASWMTAAGRAARAAGFALFGKDRPYTIMSYGHDTTVPFEHTDPLPAVRLKANDKEGLFIIDTGAAETILDPEFAKAIAVPVAGAEQGTFAGGKTGEVVYGRLSRLALGNMTLTEVPVALVSTAKFAAAANGKPVAGVIGTGLLSRFRTTIDYAKGRLTLDATKGKEPPPPLAAIPFWQVGDHFLLAAGRLNDGEPQMFFVDTGLAGAAFTAPESTLKSAGIAAPVPAGDKDGGIGTAAIAPFDVASLSLGTLRRERLSGLFGAFPPSLEMALGTRIGGIVSHGFLRPYAVTFDFKTMLIEIRDEKS